ncbi:hypothetical protein LCGC14_2876100 [marine sediment metagenome]|uniref:Uncharacterized protein n=1 Tax=marine sediment metagenome TaxID=412755 RepID=A0A0F9A9I9_9ZZZZ
MKWIVKVFGVEIPGEILHITLPVEANIAPEALEKAANAVSSINIKPPGVEVKT